MTTKTIFSGFGGQGVLSMGFTLANAAMLEGRYVTYLPSYGVEVRGGTANCTVVVSDEEIASPVASEPEVVVAMNQPSFNRFQNILQAGGLMCVNASLVNASSVRSDIEVLSIPTSELAEKLGTIKVANMIMLGVLIRASNIISFDAMIKNLAELLGEGKSKLIKLNREALERASLRQEHDNNGDHAVVRQSRECARRASHVSELLGREGVNIRAISVADTSDISTVRFVVDDPRRQRTFSRATVSTRARQASLPSRP